MSLPSWERGLKLYAVETGGQVYGVAPLVGAWVEIVHPISISYFSFVAPLVGAWVEIVHPISISYFSFVAPLVGAWVEIYNLIIQ